MKQIKLSSFWPLLPLNYVGKISYLFKVYVEVSWYQREINHKRLQHPNERDNLVVAFDLFEDQGWRMKIVSDKNNFYILQNHDGKIWQEYNKNSARNLTLLLYANTGYSCNTGYFRPLPNPAMEEIGIGIFWADVMKCERWGDPLVVSAGGGGGLSAQFLLFMQCLPQQSVLLVQQKVECAQRSSGATRWTVSPRHRKLNIMHKNVGFCLVLLCYANHTVTPNTSDQHLMSSRTQTVMN